MLKLRLVLPDTPIMEIMTIIIPSWNQVYFIDETPDAILVREIGFSSVDDGSTNAIVPQ
jgi:hypothetical protein